VLGGNGRGDTISFREAKRAVVVNLAAGTARGDGRDSISDIDAVFGSNFADIVFGSSGGNSIYGMRGADLLNGAGSSDYVDGGLGNDDIEGSGGPDTLLGDVGNDDIEGGDGDDFLNGQAGVDSLDGGADEDTCANGEAVLNCEKSGLAPLGPMLPTSLPGARLRG
jgi:Ca2+-binding RTX toxin-like protein